MSVAVKLSADAHGSLVGAHEIALDAAARQVGGLAAVHHPDAQRVRLMIAAHHQRLGIQLDGGAALEVYRPLD